MSGGYRPTTAARWPLEGAVAAVADHKVWGRRESSAYPDTGDPEQQYLVGGLTEEVIAQLGRLNPERLG